MEILFITTSFESWLWAVAGIIGATILVNLIWLGWKVFRVITRKSRHAKQTKVKQRQLARLRNTKSETVLVPFIKGESMEITVSTLHNSRTQTLTKKTAKRVAPKSKPAQDAKKRIPVAFPELPQNLAFIRAIFSVKIIKSPAFWVFMFNIAAVGTTYYLIDALLNTPPQLVHLYPASEAEWEDPRQPIVMEFDRPVHQGEFKLDMVPQLEGDIKFEKSFEQLPFSRKVFFYSKHNLEPGDESYVYIYVSNVKSYRQFPSPDFEAYFKTYRPAEVAEASIEDNAKEINVNEKLSVTFTKNPGEYSEIEYKLTPEVETSHELAEESLSIVPVSSLAQSTEYTLTLFRVDKILNLETNQVERMLEKSKIHELHFTTVKAPEIERIIPEGSSVLVDSEVKIEFSKEMMPESVMKNMTVQPEFEYEPVWEAGNKVLILKKKGNLEFGTKYEIKIAEGTQGQGDTKLKKEIIHRFQTIGSVKVAGVSPSNGAGGVGLQSPVRVTFDQEVDKKSAQSRFSISPKIEGSFSWDGNTMVFQPRSSYEYNKRYTYTISSGVKSIQGRDSETAFSFAFTSLMQTVELNVPLIRQQKAFFCNVTAASMVLQYRGVNVSQYDMYNRLPKDSTQRKVDGDTITWGDPNSGFVGNPDGNPGYGVHWGPISGAISGYGVSNQVYRGMSTQQLAKEIAAGNPVIVWWWNGINGPNWETWKTPSGASVKGLSGMHSEVVVGFIGSEDNPVSFIVKDPRGSRRVISLSSFRYLWSFYGNTGMVVR